MKYKILLPRNNFWNFLTKYWFYMNKRTPISFSTISAPSGNDLTNTTAVSVSQAVYASSQICALRLLYRTVWFLIQSYITIDLTLPQGLDVQARRNAGRRTDHLNFGKRSPWRFFSCSGPHRGKPLFGGRGCKTAPRLRIGIASILADVVRVHLFSCKRIASCLWLSQCCEWRLLYLGMI